KDDGSKRNKYSFKSTPTEEIFHSFGDFKEVTIRDGKQIVEDLIEKVFEVDNGVAILSSSQPCSSKLDFLKDSANMDKRLKLWYDTLKDREQLQARIKRRIGKRPEEMLFNLHTSVEPHDKGTIQRLLDFAGRMNPTRLSQKAPSVLPELIDSEECLAVAELQETLPKAERAGRVKVEISGLPRAAKKEIIGKKTPWENLPAIERSKWHHSKILEDHIAEKGTDIKRVLEFYPDINRLEVVGTNPFDLQHDDEIDLVIKKDDFTISSSTTESSLSDSEPDDEKSGSLLEGSVNINAGIKINDIVYIIDHKRSALNIEMEFRFECEPYQIQLQKVLRLENIGKRCITCEWQEVENRKRMTLFFGPCFNCFLFDSDRFMLLPGEVHFVKAAFHPSCVCLIKERWELRIFPNIFCSKRDSLAIQLYGKCVPPAMYVNKINKLTNKVVTECNEQAMKRLGQMQAELVPLIWDETLCPHKRVLDEREIFNAQNKGYHCVRFDDLEILRTLYNTLKAPREPPWDLQLESIKNVILRLPDVLAREFYFQELRAMQDSMICGGDQQCTLNFERERTCLIYVRGCIGNGIEEWEELMDTMEQSALKSELVRFYAQLGEESSEILMSESSPELHLLRKLRRNKFYRDALYMQTYSLLCDIAENIVSVIESTEHV
ncbi:hypothetical protein KR222_007457, partial [Zaprionus bogoriensis]